MFGERLPRSGEAILKGIALDERSRMLSSSDAAQSPSHPRSDRTPSDLRVRSPSSGTEPLWKPTRGCSWNLVPGWGTRRQVAPLPQPAVRLLPCGSSL